MLIAGTIMNDPQITITAPFSAKYFEIEGGCAGHNMYKNVLQFYA